MKLKFISAHSPRHRAASPSVFTALWLVLAFSLASAGHLSAATVRTWTGGSATSGNWSTAANWSGGVAPVAGDILSFSETGARKTSNTNNFPAGRTFSTINVFGGGYRLRGNSVTITNYITAGNPAGDNQIDLDLTAAGPGVGITLRSFDSSAQLTLTGDINLNARALYTEGPADFILSGVISGNAGIFKNNAGELTLSGGSANTYTGTTIVTAGLLRLSKTLILLPGPTFVPRTAIPGDLVIGSGTGGLPADFVELSYSSQIADTSDVTINGSGELNLNGNSDTIGSLTMTGGHVLTQTGRDIGTLTLGGGVRMNDGTAASVIDGRLDLGSGTARIFDVFPGARLTVNARVAGGTGISMVKSNSGQLYLTDSNIFAGDLEIKGGTVTITDGHALGTTNGVTRLMGGLLYLDAATSFGIPESLETSDPYLPLNEVRLLNGNVSWLGNIHLGENSYFRVETNETLSIIGQISGPGGWTKTGPGTLQFKTPYTNNYEGWSVVVEGNFIMDGVYNQPVIPGNRFYIASAQGTTRAWMIKNNQIADTTHVEINTGGVLDLAGFNDTVGRLTVRGGSTIETGTGILTLNDNLDSLRSIFEDEPARIHGRLALGGVTRTIRAYTESDPSSLSLIITAEISDGGAPAGFNKQWDGPLQLTGANTFTGPVSVTDGTLRVAHPNALGSSSAGTTVSGTNGAKIILDGGVGMTIAAEPLTLNSTGPGSPIALENFTGNNQWNGPITLLAPESVINVLSISRPLALGGAISGPGGLKKVGVGFLTLNGLTTNTFTGPSTVAAGDLILDKPTTESIHGDLIIGDGLSVANADRVIVRGLGDEIWNGSRVIVNSSGQLILDSVLDLIGSIEGAGNIFLQNNTSGLIVGRNDFSTTFDGVISGAGGFEKVGQGTLTLNGLHTYTGASGVPEGTLVVNGSIASSALVQLNRPLLPANNPPGILAGSGFVPSIFPYPGGTVSPGTSPGRLTVQGELALTDDIVRLELNGTTPGASYDQLRVNGLVKLGNSRLELTFGFTPLMDESFMLIQNDGNDPVQGTFLGIPQGSYFSAGGMTFYIEYNSGDDDNDVVISRVATPASNISSITAKEEKMVIQGEGLPGLSYVLEATPTLSTPIPWQPIATNTASALGIYEFIDAYSDGGMNLFPMRFYRVITP